MRRFIPTRLRGLAPMLLVGLLVASTAGCDEQATCDSAVGHYYDMYRYLWDEDSERLEREEAVAFCDDLERQASEAGCGAEHRLWLRCLAAADESQPCGLRSICYHAQYAVEACIAGIPYEYDCDDGADGDGDGQTDCFDPDCLNTLHCYTGGYGGFYVPQIATRSLDLLWVVDNSGSMAGENTNMRSNFPAVTMALKSMSGGMPDLHLAVTSTDLGAGGHDLTYCEGEGDGGALLTGSCTNPQGAPYVVDVAPRDCEIQREPDNRCTAHDCGPEHCAHEPSATLVDDAHTGCPRCRNYSGESLEEVFSCIADVGTMGCGFEQPLEAMYRALDTDRPDIAGFLREEAFLGVIFVTDEDDCSARDAATLFDDSDTGLSSPLGPLGYRCTEFGITCDINDRDHFGTRQGCVPRTDDQALLYPADRYVDRLLSVKDPAMLMVTAIAGPVTPSPTGIGHNLVVTADASGLPKVAYSCTTAQDGGIPGIRLFTVLEAFNEAEDLASWAYSSICSADYTPALAAMGNYLSDQIEPKCFYGPLSGCTDVAVEYGLPGDGLPCNDVCRAQCEVVETRQRNTAEEHQAWIPPCLEVCAAGFCEGNTDRSLAHASGHPMERDPALPVEACWHLRHNPTCYLANEAELRIARRDDPPPRTFALVSCRTVTHEYLCNDGEDNDGNCLVDMDDPCCQSPGSCY